MKNIRFREWGIESSRYWGLLAILAGVIALAGVAWVYMEHNGHWVTGMDNHVVWGMPHVFAVFLIVAASGALNVASIGSVFGKKVYKPLAPLSGLLAITLLLGGLMVLVLDLGRPDRLIVAMTNYNFKSIFAWNIYLYNGFLAIVIVYLWTMMDKKMGGYTKAVGTFAFVWRIALTTGTGSIFGFIVARQGYDAAVYAPMFIVMSFAFGLAIYLLVLNFAFNWDKREFGDYLFNRLKNLLGIFVAGSLYFVIAYHLTNLYGTENHEYEAFILMNGGIYTAMFWIGQIFIGALLPLGIIYHPSLGQSRGAVTAAAIMVILGGLATMYVVIIGGQAFPMAMFPGKEIIDSTFYDGGVSPYAPSLPEITLGIGGVATALLMTFVGIRVLKFLPTTLSDEALGKAE